MTAHDQQQRRRAIHLRNLAKRARQQNLNVHAQTLDDRAAEIERRLREKENLQGVP